MSLPRTLCDVREVWYFAEGDGLTSAGEYGQADLTLSGTARDGSEMLLPPTTEGLWGLDGRGWAGAAEFTIPGAWHALENEGDTITFAMVYWHGGPTRDPFLGDPYSGEVRFVAVAGGTGLDMDLYHNLQMPPPTDPADNRDVYYGTAQGSGDGVHTFREAPPFPTANPYLLIVECTRTSGYVVRTRVYTGGAKVLTDGEFEWELPPVGVKFGADAGNIGVMLGAAVWLRALTSDERAALMTADSLDELVPVCAAGVPESGLDDAGRSVWTFDFPTQAVRPVEVITGDPEGPRHTRIIGERVRRRYELIVRLGSGMELERLRTVLAAARGGAGAFYWRHPVEDPTDTDAPIWRLTNDVKVQRNTGQQSWNATLVFEEV